MTRSGARCLTFFVGENCRQASVRRSVSAVLRRRNSISIADVFGRRLQGASQRAVIALFDSSSARLRIFMDGCDDHFMTWVLGAGVMWGYGALISDVRVTWPDGRHLDALQKIYP